MKLVTFSHQGSPHIGVLGLDQAGQVIHDLNRLDPSLPADLRAFLGLGEPGLDLARRALSSGSKQAGIPLRAGDAGRRAGTELLLAS